MTGGVKAVSRSPRRASPPCARRSRSLRGRCLLGDGGAHQDCPRMRRSQGERRVSQRQEGSGPPGDQDRAPPLAPPQRGRCRERRRRYDVFAFGPHGRRARRHEAPRSRRGTSSARPRPTCPPAGCRPSRRSGAPSGTRQSTSPSRSRPRPAGGPSWSGGWSASCPASGRSRPARRRPASAPPARAACRAGTTPRRGRPCSRCRRR